jgi:hypothetical protein
MFLALFALAALGYTSLRLITHASAYSQLLRSQHDGIKHHNALRMGITPISSEHRRCDVQLLNGHPIAGVTPRAQEWHVCTTGHPHFFSSQHSSATAISPDYSALFLRTQSCPNTRIATTESVFDTPHAPFTCTLPQQLSGGLAIHDNIAIEHSVVSTSARPQLITIATPGSLLVSGSLTLSGDTLIVVGGGIEIPYLGLHHAPHASVTVISAHGDIVIKEIAGAIKILALGRRVLSVPRTLPPESPPLPPLRHASVSGVIPK